MIKQEAHSPLADSQPEFGWIDPDESAYVAFAFDCETINRAENTFCDDRI